MAHEGSMKAIIAALLANLGIAITKFIAYVFSGSASMLA
jgi:divalent metal cation (Fe/Co/Zn/Cd) transporter